MGSGAKIAFGGCACLSVLLFIVLVIFGIWAVAEQGRFDPFYTPLKCTNFFLFIPVHLFLDMSTGNLVLPPVPVNAECDNPNQLAVTMGAGTKGDVLALTPLGTVDVGDVSKAGATKFDIDSEKTKIAILMAMTMPGPMLQGIGAEITRQALAGANPPAVPLFFTLDAESKGEGAVMFLPAEEKAMLPKKFCGQLLTMVPPDPTGATSNATFGMPLPAGALKTVSVTLCRNSEEEIIPAVLALDPTAGPNMEYDHSAGYIDNLDPTPDYVKEKEDTINSSLSTFIAIFFILAGLFLIVAIVCVILMLRKPKQKAPAEPEKPQAQEQVNI